MILTLIPLASPVEDERDELIPTTNHKIPSPGPEAAYRNGSDKFEHGVSIIVPVYNEEETIKALYARVKVVMEDLGEPWELIFVDDGSQDRSVEVMRPIAQSDSHVRVVRLRRNFGQTSALSAGIDHSRGSIVIPIDADLQNDPADIPHLISKLDEGYDIVSGWRRSRKDSLGKTFPSFFANKIASWVTGVPLHDYGCTLKAYRREVLEGIHLYGDFHRFIPALASAVGARVTEIEVTHHRREFGKSKYGAGRIIRVILDLVTLKLLLAYYARPMRIFGGLGLLLSGLGTLCGLATVLMKLFLGIDMTGNPALFMTVLGIISGIQLIGLGFLGEINMRTYYETQRKPTYAVREVITQSK
jgi:glycosyltransferase involved in cell wall biosynthesis